MLDIVIPVYNEGRAFLAVVDALTQHVRTPFRLLVCYDFEEDTTLAALAAAPRPDVEIELVRNSGRGVLDAIRGGFLASRAPAVLVFPGDDDYNADRVDAMWSRFEAGADVVVASRFIKGGGMRGAPLLKAVLVRVSALALYHIARVPTRDPSNGFRLFSRRVLDRIPIESSAGFAYSIELLVKCHRLRWPIAEVPAQWYERRHGRSRFRLGPWLPEYLRWFRYAFATTYLRRGAGTVRLRDVTGSSA